MSTPLRLIALLIFLAHGAHAQLTANFSASNTSGCVPHAVVFNDQSSGGGTIVYRYWDFGYGGNISNNNNATPSAAYPVGGTFTVSLTVSDGNDTATIVKTNYINAYHKPTPSFSFTPSSGCAPLAVSFTNNSSAGSGSITAYQWDFDDGSTYSTATSPNHTYTSSGTFSPTLKVTNSHGCTKTLGTSNSVEVSGGPTVAFTSTSPQACTTPHTVTFTNQSSGVGPLSYLWTIGSTTSTAQNPVVTFTSLGSYDVTLKVTDAYGCVSTLVKNDYVVIAQVDADFDVEDPACKGKKITIDNNTLGASNYQWQWGDGNTGSGFNPNKTYNSGGTYTITLTATSGTCSDSHTETVHVQEITANFVSSPNYGCEVPHETFYADSSTVNFGSISGYIWGLEDVSPPGNYTTTDSSFSYSREEPGSYSDSLTVISAEGCTARVNIQNNVLIEELGADFLATPKRGCAPKQVIFLDQSVPTPSYPITSWTWVFDNGQTANGQNSQTTYADTGCYFPKLIIENSFGCKDSLTFDTKAEGICLGAQQNAHIVLDPDTMCASDSIMFQDSSWFSQFINGYVWDFSDGSPTFSADDPYHYHSFIDTGWIHLTYTVGQYECYDTLHLDSIAYVQGAFASFDQVMDCDTPDVRTFVSNMKDVQYFYWDFGDGSPLDSVNIHPTHTFDTSGAYMIKLLAFNDSTGCSYVDSMEIEIRKMVPWFTIDNGGELPIDSVACRPHAFVFDADTSIDEVPDYTWVVDGDTVFGNSGLPYAQGMYTRYFGANGYHTIKLGMYDINGCQAEVTRRVFISDPVASFDFDYTGNCDPTGVQFTNNSTSDTTIVEHRWHFSDATGYHYDEDPMHAFAGQGMYQVKLKITDSIGCSDETSHMVPIIMPFAGFRGDTTLCQYQVVTYTNMSYGTDLQFQWNFGNGSQSTATDPSTLYADTGYFYITMALVDSLGCRDTVKRRVHVQALPIVEFFADSTSAPCLPLEVTFSDSSKSDYIDERKWNFGDGSASVLLPVREAYHTYTEPGKFDVKLTIKTTYGCEGIEKKEEFIQVDGPKAEFGIAPDSVCVGQEVSFFVLENYKMAQYMWVFGDGEDTIVAGTVDTVKHAYHLVGTRTPIVIYSDTSKTCEIPIADTVYVHRVKSDFDFYPDSIGCGVLNTKLTNNSIGEDSLLWSFGDGRFSREDSPIIYFPKPGTFDVKLYIENLDIGCSDSLIMPFIVHDLADVDAFGDTAICLGDSTTIRAEVDRPVASFTWNPSESAVSPSSLATAVTPQTSTYFKAQTLDTNGCMAVDSVFVLVQDTPRIELFEDTAVIIGEEIVLLPRTDDDLIYQWHPPEKFDCATCFNPTTKVLEDGDYEVTVYDIYGCFSKMYSFRIEAIEKFSVDVPEAFTPNGDGNNDIVFTRGWGIKEVLDFRIFNRWGQEMFHTNDIMIGWNGEYKGAQQPMDTYAYVVRVKFYDDSEKQLEGFIELIR